MTKKASRNSGSPHRRRDWKKLYDEMQTTRNPVRRIFLQSLWNKGVLHINYTVALAMVVLVATLATLIVSIGSVYGLRREAQEENDLAAVKADEFFTKTLDRVDRMAVGIGVSEDCSIFLGNENPDLAWSNFYHKLGKALSTYSYITADSITSVMIYAPKFNRLMRSGLTAPYYLTGTYRDIDNNAGWVEELGEWDVTWATRSVFPRYAYGRYPRVMTVVRVFGDTSNGGAVAIDVKLDELYESLMTEQKADTTVFLLSGTGEIMEPDTRYFKRPELTEKVQELFSGNSAEKTKLSNIEKMPVAYTQRYVEKYDCYVVTLTELKDLNGQIAGEMGSTLLFGVACGIAICLLVGVYTQIVSGPIQEIDRAIQSPMAQEDNDWYPEDIVRRTVSWIVQNTQSNDNLKNELEARMMALQKAQMQTLKSQINPHFLFNTLNMVMMMLEKKEENARPVEMLTALSDVLSYSLRDGDLVELGDELKNTQRYMEILEARYEGLYTSSIQQNAPQVMVPRLILQPLVENAVFHGISPMEKPPGKVIISAYLWEDPEAKSPEQLVRIDVNDNGCGMTEEQLHRLRTNLESDDMPTDHIGMKNVARRLRMLYPEDSRILIDSEPNLGTCVSLIFPAEASADGGIL